jgi:hypothetical protein
VDPKTWMETTNHTNITNDQWGNGNACFSRQVRIMGVKSALFFVPR